MTNTAQLYPYIFNPILRPVVWGGRRIRPFKGMEPTDENIGESWEISHVSDHYSVVANGPLAGKTIDDLLVYHGEDLLGRHVFERYGRKFPLLIKFIDARDDLSVQVHPDDRLAAERHQSFGKTEMWYVVHADPDARLYCGFSTQSSPEDYERRVAEGTIMQALAEYKVEAGDVFFLPAGRIHAIGAGCFVAEIQQTSDITYRIYDYDRPDANGRLRELHTEWAKDAIDYRLEDDYRTAYTPQTDAPVELVSCRYFETNLLDLDAPLSRDWSALDSFVIYICMEGGVRLTDAEGTVVELHQGQRVLVPATNSSLTLAPVGKVKLLETYIPAAK